MYFNEVINKCMQMVVTILIFYINSVSSKLVMDEFTFSKINVQIKNRGNW